MIVVLVLASLTLAMILSSQFIPRQQGSEPPASKNGDHQEAQSIQPAEQTVNQSVQSQPTQTPEEVLSGWFQQKFVARKQEVFDSFHPIGQAKSITVHSVSIVWKDNRPRNDLNNILEATVRFTIYWTSPLHDDGFTKVEATYDNESERITSAKVLATNGTTIEQAGILLGAAVGTVIQYEAQKAGAQDAVDNYLHNQ